MKKTVIKLSTSDAVYLANLLIGINKSMATNEHTDERLQQVSLAVVGQIHVQHPGLITKK